MGIHYPTDLVAGALLGSGAAALGKIARVRTAVVGPLLQWLRKYPGLFYACFFAASFQIATGFGPSIEWRGLRWPSPKPYSTSSSSGWTTSRRRGTDQTDRTGVLAVLEVQRRVRVADDDFAKQSQCAGCVL